VTHVVFDTNIYVDWLNRGWREELMLGRGFTRYLSAVVQMELRIGVTTRRSQRALGQLVRGYSVAGRILLPSPRVFDDAGEVLAKLRGAGRDVRRASLVVLNDVLIALSAREIGATVYTANAREFQAIRAIRNFRLELSPAD
jgi:predicted nucleic acid-binding protein